MKIRSDDAEAQFGYLSVNGKAVSYDTSVMPAGTITGALSASAFTDPIASRDAKELALSFTLAGGSGTLAASLLFLDPMEPSNGTTGVAAGLPRPPMVLSLGGPLGAPTRVRLIVAEGKGVLYVNDVATDLGTLNVPMFWQVQLSVGGTAPSLDVLATFEARG